MFPSDACGAAKYVAELDDLTARVRRERARRFTLDFIRGAWSLVSPAPYVHGVHVEAIAAHLDAVECGDIRRLLINVPPRFGKSTIVAAIWPAKLWLADPTRRVMGASYRLDLAVRDAVLTRRLVESSWYRDLCGGSIRLGRDQNQKTRYANDRGGVRLTTSVGGGGTGEGGDFLIVDDPHDLTTINSTAERLATHEWWDTVGRHRINDPNRSAIVGVMQRGHHDDWAARRIEEGGWTVLVLAEEFESDRRCSTPWWTDTRAADGDLLWPEWRGPAAVAESKKAGAQVYASQFQQRPTPREGAFFRASWFRYFRRTEDGVELVAPGGAPVIYKLANLRIFQVCDTAQKVNQRNDFTVVTTVAVTPDRRILVLDVRRARVEVPDQWPFLQAARAAHPLVAFQGIEDAQGGTGLLQRGRREGLAVRELKPGQIDKQVRAEPLAVAYSNGYVYHLAGAPWLSILEDELLAFPRGPHDDQVDTLSYAHQLAHGGGGVRVRPIGGDR